MRCFSILRSRHAVRRLLKDMSAWTTARIGLRYVAAVTCLIAFSFGPAKLLPPVFTLFAKAEGSHFVRMEDNFRGDTKLVLRHHPGAQKRGVHSIAFDQHRHGIASQVICLLTQERGDQSDHIAFFATGCAVEDGQKKARMPSQSLVSKSVQHGTTEASAHVSPVLPDSFFSEQHASQGQTIAAHTLALRCLRSTCLLI